MRAITPNTKEYLQNIGQSKINTAIKKFCTQIGDITVIEDLRKVDRVLVTYLKYDPTTPKFCRSTMDIFNSKTYSGCSDLGLIFSSVLREKGIPTVYVETVSIDWLRKNRASKPTKHDMAGHIFLEIFVNNKWYLYDPTHRCYYLHYSCSNNNYPDNYYVFSKDLNCNNHGVFSVNDEKTQALEKLKNFNPDDYIDPKYQRMSLKEKTHFNNTLIYETLDNDPEIKEFFQAKFRESSRGVVRKLDTDEIYIFLKSKTGQYKLPGGGLHKNETPEEGFIREVKEETGCTINNIQFLGITKTFAQKSNVFTADAAMETDFNPDEEEIKAGAQKLTMSPQEATQHIQEFLDNLDLNTMEGKIAYTISHRDLKILEYYINHSV